MGNLRTDPAEGWYRQKLFHVEIGQYQSNAVKLIFILQVDSY